jgi:hypothetical protein
MPSLINGTSVFSKYHHFDPTGRGSLHFVLGPELKVELGLDAVELPVVPWLEDKNSYFQKKAHWEEDLHALYRYRDRNP